MKSSFNSVGVKESKTFCFFTSIVLKKSIAPIVFLTAQDMDEDIIQGFEAGADDYITKPFNIKIVMQRIQAILRRCKPKEIDLTMFTFGDLTIDFNKISIVRKLKQKNCKK